MNYKHLILIIILLNNGCNNFDPRNFIVKNTGANICANALVEQIDVGYPEEKDLFKAKVTIPVNCSKEFLMSVSKSSRNLCDEKYINNNGCAYFYNKRSVTIQRNGRYFEVQVL